MNLNQALQGLMMWESHQKMSLAQTVWLWMYKQKASPLAFGMFLRTQSTNDVELLFRLMLLCWRKMSHRLMIQFLASLTISHRMVSYNYSLDLHSMSVDIHRTFPWNHFDKSMKSHQRHQHICRHLSIWKRVKNSIKIRSAAFVDPHLGPIWHSSYWYSHFSPWKSGTQ